MAENPYQAPLEATPVRWAPPRSKLLATIGSLIVPGLGQFYVGRTKRAIAWLASIVVGVAIVLVLALVVGVDPGYALAGTVVVGGSLRVIGAVDAWRLASRNDRDASGVPSASGYVVYLVAWLGVGQGVSYVVANFVHSYTATAGSMEPTLEVGDNFVLTNFSERDRLVQRGDLVVLVVPGNESEIFVKRVVGLPGETIAFAGGAFTVDGRSVSQEPCPDFEGCVVERVENGNRYRLRVNEPREAFVAEPSEPSLVPEGHVFVVGDNRYNSYDSREFGPVPLTSLRGRVRSLLLPLSRIGPIPGATVD